MEPEQFQRHFDLARAHWWYVATNDLFVNLVRRHVSPGEALLDVGCGTGSILSLLPDYECWGVDPSPAALGFCRRRGLSRIVAGDGGSLPFRRGAFAAGLLLDVLYHEEVRDELALLREVRDVLKPGGHLFLQVPAYEWLRSGHDVKARSARRYTAGRVREMLRQTNFEVIRLSYRVSTLLPLAVIQRKLLRSKDSDMRPMSPVVNSILGSMASLENRLLDLVDLPFGLSVFAVARKHGSV
ncbi:MAG: class I SAM-dependent methyltransferase [Elusimicrobiota bacterium]